MPDGSLECLLGRMEQKICDIKDDLSDIKEEQKRLANYIDTQRIGVKIIAAFFLTVGSAVVYWKEHVERIFVTITKG